MRRRVVVHGCKAELSIPLPVTVPLCSWCNGSMSWRRQMGEYRCMFAVWIAIQNSAYEPNDRPAGATCTTVIYEQMWSVQEVEEAVEGCRL